MFSSENFHYKHLDCLTFLCIEYSCVTLIIDGLSLTYFLLIETTFCPFLVIYQKRFGFMNTLSNFLIQVNLDMTDHCTTDFCIWRTICLVPVRCISCIRHMYMTDFAYDGPIILVPLSPSYPSSPVFVKRSVFCIWIHRFFRPKLQHPPDLKNGIFIMTIGILSFLRAWN